MRGFSEAQARFTAATLPDPMAAHEAVMAGLPAGQLLATVETVALLRDPGVFEGIMGISLRTYQRLKDQPEKRLDHAVSGRLWRFREVFARAAELLGGAAEAEAWLAAPQMALDQRRPIELLASPAGATLVETLLDRMDYGVYA